MELVETGLIWAISALRRLQCVDLAAERNHQTLKESVHESC